MLLEVANDVASRRCAVAGAQAAPNSGRLVNGCNASGDHPFPHSTSDALRVVQAESSIRK